MFFIHYHSLFFVQLCEPVKKLKKCKFFRDVTWTNIIYPDNSTQQVMHCRCPKNSVAYLVKRHAYQTETGLGYQFSFACSPQTVSVRGVRFLPTPITDQIKSSLYWPEGELHCMNH
jgi:hypothetical protein